MSNKNNKENERVRWLIKIFFITFVLSITFNCISAELVENLSMVISVVVLVSVIMIGILFDIIGTAFTSADEVPFHAKAADKKRGAKQAVKLVKNADRVSNVCADVIGDICGVLSGATSALISVNVANLIDMDVSIVTMLMASVVTAITVLGKGICKGIAIKNSTRIVSSIGVFLDIIGIDFNKN